MTKDAPSPQLARLSKALLSSSEPLSARFRALFTLKNLAVTDASLTEDVITLLGESFADDSALLKHELAYCLGQIADLRAVPKLERVVQDKSQDVMVRHEAAEALGAISSLGSLPLLKQYEKAEGEDSSVRETCELAIRKIEWDHSEEGKKARELDALAKKKAAEAPGNGAAHQSFAPIDPAPALLTAKASQSSGQAKAAASSLSSLDPEDYDIPSLQSQLTNGSLPLFDRYRAMFSLRNAIHACSRAAEKASASQSSSAGPLHQKAEQAVLALAAGLNKSEKSALFRHEICFVFGELCHKASIPAMLDVLNDNEEHEMVRHEAAEALGGIAEEAEEEQEAQKDAESGELKSVMQALTKWANDMQAPRVVRESCVVALDEMACE